MSAEMILDKNIRYDRGGKPVEVVIAYEDFVDFIETYGLDLSEDEKESIRASKAAVLAGREEEFVDFDEVKREFGLRNFR